MSTPSKPAQMSAAPHREAGAALSEPGKPRRAPAAPRRRSLASRCALPTSPGRSASAIALPLALLACTGLAACGGSSATSTSTAADAAASASKATTAPSAPNTPATGTGASTTSNGTATGSAAAGSPTHGAAPGAGAGGAFRARIATVRACLQKDGVTLTKPGSGARGGFLSQPQLPKGMTHAQYTELLRKCAGSAGPAVGAGSRFTSPRFRAALASFAACLRQNGVNIPPPNTSGKGPIFNTRGINTASPQFRQARLKCRGTLVSALRAGSGAAAHGAGG